MLAVWLAVLGPFLFIPIDHADAVATLCSHDDACNENCTEEEEALTDSAFLQMGVAKRNLRPDISLLRIQKTGGTSFGKMVMPRFCYLASQKCEANYHRDWNQARRSTNIAILLRHPVERTISEFHFLHTNRWAFDQSQWDVPFDVKDLIWSAIQARDLRSYLRIKQNPSLNRQTLYLAGFKPSYKINFRSGKSVSIGKGIDWKLHGPELLEKAKEHLTSSKVSLGLTEQFECSMKVFSKAYGWPVDEVLAKAHNISAKWLRKQNKTALAYALGGPRKRHGRAVKDFQKWSDTIDDTLEREIETANAIDMKLYNYAETLFDSRVRGMC